MKSAKFKKTGLKVMALAAVFMIITPDVFAAKYYLSDNDSIVKGCGSTIEIKADTEGSNVMAGDTTLSYNSDEVTINQLSIGSTLPMNVFSQFADEVIKLSGARLPLSGAFKGIGTFGYINFTPSATKNSGTFTFSADLNIDNTLVDDSISNVLTSAVSKTYTFKERYNKEVDGVGFCTPDTTQPNIQFVTPLANSANNPVDTNIIFTITDNRAGVDINSLKFSVDGIDYTNTSSQVTVNKEGAIYRVVANPDTDFAQGKSVNMNVNVCDLNKPANCATRNTTFKIYTPTPPPPVCGDSIANYENGEQCDDGNKVSGDGCSSLCLWEIIVIEAAPGAATYTCSDGLHNQGESGIDCGGPCTAPCPTCVDGIKNQDEESVDCGGPCPPCGGVGIVSCPVPEKPKFITICHYPEDTAENPYSLVIPEDEWQAYNLTGDTLGACPVFDICSEALLLAAPEREEKAIEDIATMIEEKGVVEVQKTVISAPKVVTEVVNQIDVCKANPAYAKADFDDASADTDGDGMSDRMECYAETSPVNADTDGDGCSDYGELNHYYTDPTDKTDCRIEEKTATFSDALITDPQPGWILNTIKPEISGKVPSSTVLVLVVATQSEQAHIPNMLKAVDSLLALKSTDSSASLKSAVDNLYSQAKKAKTFLETYGNDFNSQPMKDAISLIPTDLSEQNVLDKDTVKTLESIKAALAKLITKPIVAVASTQLSDTTVGEFKAKNFEEVSNALIDKAVYDLIATAYLADGTQVSSKAVRFSVDRAITIKKPIPRTIGGKLIPAEATTTAFKDLIIGGKAFAQDEEGATTEKNVVEVEIEDTKPTVTGETEFGSQVFAIWNSVVLSSSVISDSEQGAFEVQAPRNLEVGIPHRVTLYAVKTENNNKIRSESVNVYFTIKKPGVGIVPIATASSGVALLMVATYIIRRLLQLRSTVKLLSK